MKEVRQNKKNHLSSKQTFADAKELADWQNRLTQSWDENHNTPPQKLGEGDKDNWQALLTQNHSHNFQLWLHEDKARREDMGFSYVYQAKRAIDAHNQQRNNMIELMDEILYTHFLIDENQKNGVMHSETPGMIIDRLSILSLKCFYMNKQSLRQDVGFEHKKKCEEKTRILKLQRQHLIEALEVLFADIKSRKCFFRIYKQMKMYNDPTLNPQLYTKS